MAVLEVVIWPEKVLETRAEEVTKFDAALKEFVSDMHETMKAANGIGLAANQVASLQRIVTIEIPWTGDRYPEEGEKKPWHDTAFTFINPKIVKKAGEIKYQEGCLSFPEIFDFVDRAAEVWVEAYDVNGKKFELHADGLMAICLQHEVDHLDGIVFINRMSRLKNTMIRKKISKRGRLEVEAPE